MRRIPLALVAVALVAAACTSAAGNETTTAQAESTTAPAPDTTDARPATAPASVVFEAQESDGSSIVVASVTLPAPGFIAVHSNSDGAPGPIIGHSDLLPEGTTTDVSVALDTPLEAAEILFPMAHIDINGNGVYEFAPPDNTIDGPAMTADGEVAVVGSEVTVPGDAASVEIVVANGSLGDILVDDEGNTLYLFTPDSQSESSCYDQCATNWPPLVEEVSAGTGVDASLIGSTTRADGNEPITYNGWPLYYFAGDAAPGDANGQGLNGVWFVVSPLGDAIE